MRTIIEGRVYDTETAQCICGLDCRHNRGDFGYHETDLYRSPGGQFFIAGWGGPDSLWARSAGQNSWSGGGGLRLVGEAEARAIMEAAGLDADDFRAAGLAVTEG